MECVVIFAHAASIIALGRAVSFDRASLPMEIQTDNLGNS